MAILPERNLNNGQPSLHAWLMSAAAPRAGEHVVHIGTAILAQLVGRPGKVTAIEYDAELAARCTHNLRAAENVTVLNGDGTKVDFVPAEVIYVNAGTTHPLPHWLDRLGGRWPVDRAVDRGRFSAGRHPARHRVPDQASRRGLCGA